MAALGSRFWRGFGHNGPRGPQEGPPALVIPGFLASDRTALELRRALAEAGFRVHPWRQGINWGAKASTLDDLKRAVDLCGAREPVLLVGWSLGGLYAREIARAEPARVRAVVTLGSPVWGDLRRYTNVWKLYERVARHPVDNPPIPHLEDKPPVPTLAIWSRRDGIVGAPSARGTEATRDKAVEVDSTHMGFAVSKTATRRAVREIVSFLNEAEATD
ncbi:alpha/beta fold hydrolase [Sphingomonas sinipercae]|uniref:alpha/beta fold hydrolase n=1 Tax=Sphingomonas sinipercae TaxID=2714944 RepID=UPI00248461EA|nr:alpha/beta hydrolase [Sphingomonas sinipercae]